jgi:hypothetical protein
MQRFMRAVHRNSRFRPEEVLADLEKALDARTSPETGKPDSSQV